MYGEYISQSFYTIILKNHERYIHIHVDMYDDEHKLCHPTDYFKES